MSSYKHEILITHYCIDTDTLSEQLQQSIASFRMLKARVVSLQGLMLLRQADDNITVLLLSYLRLREAELEKLLIEHCYIFRRFFEYLSIVCPDLLSLVYSDNREAHYSNPTAPKVGGQTFARNAYIHLLRITPANESIIKVKINVFGPKGETSYDEIEVLLVVDPFNKTAHPVKYEDFAEGNYFMVADPMQTSATPEFDDTPEKQSLINSLWGFELQLMLDSGAVFRPFEQAQMQNLLRQLDLSLDHLN
jgi:hypothetical protein